MDDEPKTGIARDRRVPWLVWAAAAALALLHALPVLQLLVVAPPAGHDWLPIGYNPRDWLQYVALVRQPAATGEWLLANPSVTDPQDGRFVLLFHQALGAVHAATGIDPFVLVEVSRVPLLFLFFAVLWRFLLHVLADRRRCAWAIGLIAFAGGLEAFALPLSRVVLEDGFLQEVARLNLWHLYGWSTFAAAHNPLWLAGLTLLLLTLRPLLQPGGPRTTGDRLWAGGGLVLLALTHFYSLVLAVAALGGVIVAELALAPRDLRRRLVAVGGALALPLLLLAALAHWQRQDAVFNAASDRVFGPQASGAFWLPLTFGVLGFLALRGMQRLATERHPWTLALGGWIGAIILISSSPVLNGFHFVFGLHLPVCVAAAAELAPASSEVRNASPARRLGFALLLVLLFLTPAHVTLSSVAEARATSAVPSTFLCAARELAELPPSRLLLPAELGNLVPAYAAHRVWVGHWFMTPDYQERAEWYRAMVAQPRAYAGALRELVARHRLGAVVVPAAAAEEVERALAPQAAALARCGDLVILGVGDLGGSDGAPPPH